MSRIHQSHVLLSSGTFQCSIPAFEGLLEGQHDRRLMKLLYRLSEWHGLAKLRMHTEASLELMEDVTKELGKLLRQFRQLTCSQFNTIELAREADARLRRTKDALAATPDVRVWNDSRQNREQDAQLDSQAAQPPTDGRIPFCCNLNF